MSSGRPGPAQEGSGRGWVVRLIGLVGGGRTPLDGLWLVEYDPTRPGTGPAGQPMAAHIVCTADRAQAARYPTTLDAYQTWRGRSGRTRSDGQPDRPLTAYNIAVEQA